MSFCPECGGDHHADDRAAAAAVITEVEIARINAERDIAVAKIGARQDANWNETRLAVAEIETDATVAAAAVEGQMLGAVLDDDAPEPAPVIIDAPPLPDPEPGPVDDDAPPPVEEHHEPADDQPRKRGLGMW